MFTLNFSNYTLTIILIIIFLKGYFPVNQYKTEPIDPPNKLGSFNVNPTKYYKPSYDRLILMVIDALREDFVTEEKMPFTFKHKSCLIPVKVEPPTVTLPRIKAITMGSVPQFADIVLNLGSATKVEDSFLHRASAAGKKMVFYGDDTWLKMYPDLFVRKEGTISFFVNDFYEVDNNVTRHLDQELINEDWDMLFLHYLGLDHIGHVQGPFSDLVKPKLHEMDSIIKTLYESLQTWNKKTLLLITGDHGMKDSGGHGGTTYQETHVPLIAFSSSCGEQKLARQTDIPITLSALFGLQMYAGGIGNIIFDFFTNYEPNQLLYILYYNFLVLTNRTTESDEKCGEIIKMHNEFLNKTSNYEDLLKSYEICLKEISTNLIRSSVEQDVILISFAFLAIVASFVYIIYNYCLFLQNRPTNSMAVIYLYSNTFLFLLFYSLQYTVTHFFIINLIVIATGVYKLINMLLANYKQSNVYSCLLLTIIHGFLLQSSSFIEEEHQIWYFYTGIVSVLMFYETMKLKNVQFCISALTIIGTLRFLQTLNSTGHKYASYPDLAGWFMQEANLTYYIAFHAISLILVHKSLVSLSETKDIVQRCLYVLTLFLIFLYKMYCNNNDLAKIIWGLIVLTSLGELKQHKNALLVKLTLIWVLIITLLLRPYNTILIPSCFLFSNTYKKHITRVDISTLVHLWLGYALFFCQGHSNSIASIDISVGYIGLNSYIPWLVFILTLFHTYSFPVLAYMLLLIHNPSKVNEIFVINIINRLWVLIVIYVTVIIQSQHLLIWSVFAPKLLIESTHTLSLFLYICVVKCFCYLENIVLIKFKKT